VRDEIFIKRDRVHEEPHVRTIERQMLDALLRIEELLKGRFGHAEPEKKVEAKPKGRFGK
jgi:hypothetical protein